MRAVRLSWQVRQEGEIKLLFLVGGVKERCARHGQAMTRRSVPLALSSCGIGNRRLPCRCLHLDATVGCQRQHLHLPGCCVKMEASDPGAGGCLLQLDGGEELRSFIVFPWRYMYGPFQNHN